MAIHHHKASTALAKGKAISMLSESFEFTNTEEGSNKNKSKEEKKTSI